MYIVICIYTYARIQLCNITSLIKFIQVYNIIYIPLTNINYIFIIHYIHIYICYIGKNVWSSQDGRVTNFYVICYIYSLNFLFLQFH